MSTLVTGAAGFIGFSICRELLERGEAVVGIDNLDEYYSVDLKQARLAQLESHSAFEFHLLDISDAPKFQAMFERVRPEIVLHFAAQAGVRYSIPNPQAYLDANLKGFLNVLEACRHFPVEHLIFASSSSVYGANRTLPYSEDKPTEHPLSFYAATKKANEMMAHAYSHLFRIPATALRLFTVYGPWGRPDMALFSFTEKILAGEKIDVFHGGKHRRDFTYIDDVVESVVRLIDKPATPDPDWDARTPRASSSSAPFQILNIGNHQPVVLDQVIEYLEKSLDKKAVRNDLPMQPGDIIDTYADVQALEQVIDYRPQTPVEEGVRRFVAWYREYYRV